VNTNSPKLSWRTYATMKFVARTILVVQGGMLLCELVYYITFRSIPPTSGLIQSGFLHYFHILGGSSRFTFPILIAALAIELSLPSEQDLALHRTMMGRLIVALVVFIGLQLIGWVTFVALVLLLSWH